MRQEIYDDPFSFNDWDRSAVQRCFVHLTNAELWHALTGEAPPTRPPTAHDYTEAGLPWFDYYGEGTAYMTQAARIKQGKDQVRDGRF